MFLNLDFNLVEFQHLCLTGKKFIAAQNAVGLAMLFYILNDVGTLRELKNILGFYGKKLFYVTVRTVKSFHLFIIP